jgi:hypothetical protein
MTKYTRQVGDATLAVQCRSALEAQAAWLLDTISAFKSQGKGLADGVRIQVGWSLLTLQQRGGELVVCEPAYADNPFSALSDDVSATLTVLAQQRDLLAKLGVQGAFALFNEKIVLLRGALNVEHIYLERSEPTAGDSGWYIAPVEGDAPDESADPNEVYESIYVYQLLQSRPSLLPVLALPSGYLVVFQGQQIEAVLNESGVNVWSGA